MYRIKIPPLAVGELARLRAFERTTIAQAIWQQLTHEPATPTRQRKLLEGEKPSFEAVPPIWQLRVGEYRVFYDVNEEEKTVTVRAIRQKPPERRTEDLL